ncbi:hypothetical protein DL93DRAFT_582631 [Clavulina sp. PMI_390]|nr:hypothetical protein DL93DRAFT_582631 [Clavulina sp. PMI_390]
MRVPDALEPLLESDVSHSSDAYSPPPEAAAQKGKGKAVTHLISDSSSDTDDAPAMSESDLEPKQKTRKPAPQKGQSGPAATAPKMLRTATTYSLTLKAKTSLKVMSAKHLRDQREGNDVIAASDAMQDVATELNYLATGEQFEEQAATGETRFKSATLRLLKNGWRQTAVSKFLTIIAQNSEYIRYDGYALEQRLGGHS